MLGRLRNSYAEIDLSRLEQNFLALAAAMGGTSKQLAPMVKADAYGHGDIQVARVCEKLGARYVGVALVEEGIRLRLAGIQIPILVFSHFDSISAEAIVKYRLTPVISQFEQIAKLKSILHEQASYPVHVKFNTGMQRLGFEPEEAMQVVKEFEHDAFLHLEGVCTHFTASDDFVDSNGETQQQIKIFSKISENFKGRSKIAPLFHYLNSGAILTRVTPKLDLGRPGLALYGAYPTLQVKPAAMLEPVMSVKSFVGYIHKIKKGKKVSYGGTWQAKQDSVIAVVPIGYADGVPRALSNKGMVLIRGELCPIAGIVCMDYIMIDVTTLIEKNLGPVVGDEVTLIGKQKNKTILAEEVAALASSIPYEILTGIQARIPRVYIH